MGEGLAYAPNRETSGDADESLVVRAREGDEEAFAAIVRSHQRRVYAVAMRMTRRHEVADDITQDTFVRAYRSLARFELGRPLLPWLKRIAVNLSIDYLNGARREQPLDEQDCEPAIEARHRGEEPLESNPERRLESEELARALDRAILLLSIDQRAVFLLKVVEGMRYQEIAEVLGISEGTVMSRLSRARGCLKEMLAPHLGSQPRTSGAGRT